MEIPASPLSERPSSAERPRSDQRSLTYEEEQLAKTWADPPGIIGKLKALQNDTLGARIMITAFSFFLIAGILALLMRIQLIIPENNFLSPDRFNELFTMHGSTMMYLFAVPMLEGFAILLLPFLLGNREMPFPRLGVFSFFTFLFSGILFYASFLFGEAPDAGWFAYVPLSGPEFSGRSMDFWLLALGAAEIGAISAGIEIIIAILRMRAPGMTLGRMPLMAWGFLVMAFAILFAFTPLMVGSLLLELDRQFGTQFFNPALGGSPVLWQHLFWIFGHPEVYIQFIPAAGMVSMIIPVFSRRPILGYPFIVIAQVAVGFVSFGLWVHHMFTVGLPESALGLFSAASMMIALPTGVQIFSWLATIASGRPVFRVPFLFIIGFFFIFVLGGITGVMVASVPFDAQVHDTYFVVAHFHYVLIGGVTFPIFAALYYWLPKVTGKLQSERLGKWHFWLMFIGFNITFFPQHIVGLLGMPRRVYTFPSGIGWEPYNFISTVGAFILAAGVLIGLVNLFSSRVNGKPAGRNPWDADSLEWATESPPPDYGFAVLPVVNSRHPLWEQKQTDMPDSPARRLVQDFARWPLHWRAALVTSTLDAKPQEIFRVAGPSIWPFIAAVGIVIFFASEVWAAHTISLIGVLILVVSIIGWNWPSPVPMTEDEEQRFEDEHKVNVRRGSSRAVAMGGMALLILVLAVALASMLFSYFYIRLENTAWPPENIPPPNLIWTAISTALLMISGAAVYWALRSVRTGNTRRMQIALLLGFILAAVAAAVQVYDFSTLPFGWTHNAYASIFFLIGGFMVLLVGGLLIMNALVQYWALKGQYSQRRHMAVEITSVSWFAAIVGWIVAFGVLYLAPYLT